MILRDNFATSRAVLEGWHLDNIRKSAYLLSSNMGEVLPCPGWVRAGVIVLTVTSDALVLPLLRPDLWVHLTPTRPRWPWYRPPDRRCQWR